MMHIKITFRALFLISLLIVPACLENCSFAQFKSSWKASADNCKDMEFTDPNCELSCKGHMKYKSCIAYCGSIADESIECENACENNPLSLACLAYCKSQIAGGEFRPEICSAYCTQNTDECREAGFY